MRRFDADRLVLATHNAGKLEEMRALLQPHGITLLGATELGLTVPEETADSFFGNARLKAMAAMEATGLPALADDSGLCVDELDGAPGIHTADWAETPGDRDFGQAMRRVRDALEQRNAAEPWLAQFRVTLVLAWTDRHIEVFEGLVTGHLVWPPRWPEGHGYDPIFIPGGYDRTFAEMAIEEKNRISHRARAFQKLEEILG